MHTKRCNERYFIGIRCRGTNPSRVGSVTCAPSQWLEARSRPVRHRQGAATPHIASRVGEAATWAATSLHTSEVGPSPSGKSTPR